MFDMQATTQTFEDHEHQSEINIPSYIRSAITSEAPRDYKSRAARRAVDQETLLCVSVRDATFGSQSEAELAQRLRSSVFGSREYEKIPKFRKSYVQGYSDGVQDAIAQAQGRTPGKQLPESTVRVPKWVDRLQPGVRWRRHPIGGGWVSKTAYVEADCYVGPLAAVFDRARVLGHARIFGESRAFGDAEIWGSAQVRAGALIHGSAQLCDRCVIIGLEIFSGRVDGATVLRKPEDLLILTSRHARRTVLPPPMPGHP